MAAATTTDETVIVIPESELSVVVERLGEIKKALNLCPPLRYPYPYRYVVPIRVSLSQKQCVTDRHIRVECTSFGERPFVDDARSAVEGGR